MFWASFNADMLFQQGKRNRTILRGESLIASTFPFKAKPVHGAIVLASCTKTKLFIVCWAADFSCILISQEQLLFLPSFVCAANDWSIMIFREKDFNFWIIVLAQELMATCLKLFKLFLQFLFFIWKSRTKEIRLKASTIKGTVIKRKESKIFTSLWVMVSALFSKNMWINIKIFLLFFCFFNFPLLWTAEFWLWFIELSIISLSCIHNKEAAFRFPPSIRKS